MVAATYVFEVDTERDATFANTYDNITAYVMDATWGLGMVEPYQKLAPESRLSLTLNNIGGEFRQDTFGDELVTNGSFATWSGNNPSSWTVTGESGSDPYVNEVGAGEFNGGSGTGFCNLYTTSAALSIAQTILTPGERYVVVFDIDGVGGSAGTSLGGIVCKCGGAAISPVYHLAGRKTFVFYATATDFTIAADNGDATVDVTIDNVSVKAATRYYRAIGQGTMVRVRTTAPVAETLFVGKIASAKQTAGAANTRLVTLSAIDAMGDLMDVEYVPELQEDVTTDVAIQEVFDKAVIPWPYSHSYWMLGVEGASELDTTAKLYEQSATSFDTGSTTFDFTGDNFDRGNGISGLGFIRDVLEAELGRFFYSSRDNAFVFHRRHRDLLNATVTATFTAADFEIEGTQYDEWDDLVNHATVNYQPRAVGEVGTVLWASGSQFTLPPKSSRTISARYRDTENPAARVGGKDIITPVKTGAADVSAVSQVGDTTAFTINYASAEEPILITTTEAHGYSTSNVVFIEGVRGLQGANGTRRITVVSTTTFTLNETRGVGAYAGGGTVSLQISDLSHGLDISVEEGAASSKITLINHLNRVMYIPYLQLRGTPITVFDRQFVEARNGDSARDYKYAPRTYDVLSISDVNTADDYANWHVFKFGTPFPYFRNVAFNANKTASRMTQALTRSVGDRITVSESWTGHSEDYFIVGENHRLAAGGDHTHEVAWTLKPAERESFWILDTSTLGINTRLAF